MPRLIFINLALVLTALANCGAAQGLVKKFARDTTGSRPVLASYTFAPTPTPQAAPEIPINFATCNYGIFCRTEVKLDKVTPVKVRFRLGSAQQTDWLEGKPGAVHP